MKYLVVTGGVVSGLGKGITASSIGLLLKSVGIAVTAIKIDPYLNIDAGTMSPYEHGECYVLEDGGESDLDLGNYERFLDINLTRDHNITTGKVYDRVIRKERQGVYLGKTVQIVPHITDEIQDWIKQVSGLPVDKYERVPEVCIIEVGGTIGDIETAPFIEAIRHMAMDDEDNQFCYVHLSLIIDNGELKTKPTQHSVAKLRSLGIIPDLLVMRTPEQLGDDIKKKLSVFCHIKPECIVSNANAPNIYYVPALFKEQKVCEKVGKVLDLEFRYNYQLDNYYKIIEHFSTDLPTYKIGIAGKYTGSPDTYLSLIRAIEHASFITKVKIEIEWINCEDLTRLDKILHNVDGVIIPGGFGSRGIAGKIKVAKYCRENKKPLLGICLGMQVMVSEIFQANGYNAGSSEWSDQIEHHVIYLLPDQDEYTYKGGSMRLGNFSMDIVDGSKLNSMYKQHHTVERHRHRYEFANSYKERMEELGLMVCGLNIQENLVEAVELDNHPYYVGCQYHPEFKSRYDNPHPLFIGLLDAIIQKD